MRRTTRFTLTLAATAFAVGGAAVPVQAATGTATGADTGSAGSVVDGPVVNGPLVDGPLVDLTVLDESAIANNLISPFFGNYMDNRDG